MRRFVRPILIVCLALLVPIIPFLGFGPWLEDQVTAWLDPPPPAGVLAALVVGLLASDILLPIPSSVVSTAAGAQLGIAAASVASWLGMTAGACLGFALARQFGRSLAARFASRDDLDELDALAERHGATIVVATRALPVLAEAAVLVVGTTRMAWRPFLVATMLSNLGIALVYATLGSLARSEGELPLALVASVALPLLATAIARRLIRRRTHVATE